MARCMACRKSLFKCTCHSDARGKFESEKSRQKVTDKRGRTRTVTKATGNKIRGGTTWCGKCSCRVVGGTCMNSTCSTRRVGR